MRFPYIYYRADTYKLCNRADLDSNLGITTTCKGGLGTSILKLGNNDHKRPMQQNIDDSMPVFDI